jgi:hypothetical protein
VLRTDFKAKFSASRGFGRGYYDKKLRSKRSETSSVFLESRKSWYSYGSILRSRDDMFKMN